MAWLEDISESVHRLVRTPLHELTEGRRRTRYAIDLSRHCFLEMRKNHAAQTAAALTYHTLFSLIPTVITAFVLFKAFKSIQGGLDPEIASLKDWIIAYLIPPDSSGSLAARQALAERLQTEINNLLALDLRGVGVMGVLIFLWGAMNLLITIERTFNQIFDVERPRPWHIRIPLYYAILTVGPLLLVLGNLWRNAFLNMITHSDRWVNWLAGPMVFLSPMLTTWLVFFALFVLVPHTKVQWRAAAIGSFASAICLVIGQMGFSIYVSRAAITSLYGGAALLPLFLLWIWLIWLIVIFGLELTYTLQTLRGKLMKEEEARREAQIVGDPQWLLPILTQIAQAFDKGRAVSEVELAQRLRLPARSVHRLSERLAAEGLIHCMNEDEKELCNYTLALPPDKIPMSRLIDMVHGMTTVAGADRKDPGWALIDRFADAQKQAAQGMTLRSLIAG